MSPRATRVLARRPVADHDLGVRRSIAAMPSRGGFDVTIVDDGAPANELDSGGFEIVVVDLHMQTSGLAAVRPDKRCYGSRVYCAVLSGEHDATTRAARLEAGADEVFAGPTPAAALRRRFPDGDAALRATERTA